MEKQMEYNELFDHATSICEKSGLQAAMAYLDNCIKENPDYVEAYLTKGMMHERILEDFQKASNSYSKAIELDAKCVQAYITRADLYGRQREFQKAITDLTKVIEISPDSSEKATAYYNRGLSYANLGSYQEASRDFEKCLEIATDSETASSAKESLRKLKNGQTSSTKRDSAISWFASGLIKVCAAILLAFGIKPSTVAVVGFLLCGLAALMMFTTHSDPNAPILLMGLFFGVPGTACFFIARKMSELRGTKLIDDIADDR